MYIRQHSTDRPDAPAIIMASTGESLSFGFLEERANRLSDLFRRRGLRPGDHIAVQMENHPRYFEIILAASRTGLYYTPISAHLTGDETAFVLDDSTSTIFFTSTKLLPVAAQAVAQLSRSVEMIVVDAETTCDEGGYEHLLANGRTQPPDDERAGVAMMYSSGTTGRPKGIKRPLGAALPADDDSAIRMGRGLMKFRPGMTLLSPAPLYHAAPHAAIAAALQLGATSIVMGRFDAIAMLSLIERYRVTHVQLVPTMMSRLLQLPAEERDRFDLSSLEAVVHSAAPCPIPVKRAMIEWLGPIVYEYYGATESYGFTRCTSTEWLAHEGTVGRSVFGEIVIADDDGRPCANGVIGTVWFVSGSRFEYFGVEAGKEVVDTVVPGGTTVGDVGWVDDDGYLYLTDRKTFMIISGGINIYPQEVENALAEHPAVCDVAVIGVPDADLGEAVKAVVVLEVGYASSPTMQDELIAFSRDRVAGFKCPRSVDFVKSLPRLESGKLAKRLVREPYWLNQNVQQS